jgi:hypothetical protein
MTRKRNMRRTENWSASDISEIVFRGINSIMEGQSGSNWTGTMTNLTTALNRVLSKRQRTFLPGSPGALRVVINRVVNRLRNRGIGVRFGRTTDHARTRFVRFTR